LDNQVKQLMRVSLYSNELLSLKDKSAYIKSFYRDHNIDEREQKNDGFIVKFNNSIGFKPVIDIAKSGFVLQKTEVNPEDFIAPAELLFNNMETPVESFDIAVFYIAKKNIKHTKQEFSYDTYDIAKKWQKFLEKVYPKLLVKIDYISKRPKLSLRDFTFQYFYRNLQENFPYTLEFSSKKKLKNADMAYIVPKLQTLSNDRISIAQRECETCLEYSNGINKFHIEIVYLTKYGTDNDSEKAYKYYGDSIYKAE
jgi:hypothetical protein